MAKTLYQKGYKMREAGGGYEVTIPKLVVERAARKAELPLDEFIKQYRVIHLFNDFPDFDGAYRFEKIEPEKGNGVK
jgi:hypothetical protein